MGQATPSSNCHSIDSGNAAAAAAAAAAAFLFFLLRLRAAISTVQPSSDSLFFNTSIGIALPHPPCYGLSTHRTLESRGDA